MSSEDVERTEQDAKEWGRHPDNESPERVAARFGWSVERAREHVGPHRCIDGRLYNVSCLVSDPAMDRVARRYLRAM